MANGEEVRERPQSDAGHAPYEAPRIVPLGNLHDLLAGGGSLQCDNDFTSGFTDPPGNC